MNPLELYKKLPRKNCGKCSVKTCMPFALSVIRGELALSECPYLSGQEIAAIQDSFTVFDWRHELVLKLREEICCIDFAQVAPGIGAEMKDGSMRIKCLGREFMISPTGDITTHGPLTPWIQILLLHYIRTAGNADLTGRWVSFSELRGGMVKSTSFLRDCEQPLTDLFEKDAEKAASVLIAMGAEQRADMSTENAWHLSLLPRLPVIILYWPGEKNNDEEFPAKVKIIFDSSADKFLDVESLIFLVEGLVKNMERHIGQFPTSR